MLNQIFLYVAYGLGAVFLIGGFILLIGILKPTKEQSATAKAEKLAAKQAKEAAKKDKSKSKFGASNRKKDKEFFTTNNIGENNDGFVLEDTSPEPVPSFQVPKSNIPPKSSFQAAAFASKNPQQSNQNTAPETVPEPEYNNDANVNIPAPNFNPPTNNVSEETEVPKPKPAGKSVFGSGGFKLAEGSDTNSDSNKEGNRFNLPF